MEYHIYVLVVITLLQLCRAEILDSPPGTWFSANTINDGYSPKPISELFSTESPPPNFSTENPIVVLPKSSSLAPEQEITRLSSTPTTFGSFATNTPIPPITFTGSLAPSNLFSDTFHLSPLSQLDFSKTPSIASQWPISTVASPIPSTERPFQSLQESLAISPLVPQSVPSDPPNFSLIYENTPPSVQTRPASQPVTTVVTQIPTLSTTTSSPLTSISEGTITPFITSGLSDPTSRPTVTFRSTPPSTTSRTTSFTRDITTRLIVPVSTQVPLRIVTGPPDVPFKPSLSIRVVAPHGSITNVKINPTTTTKRPTTKRSKKPKRNSYEGCLEGCKGRKDPVCAVPLASTIIDTKTLKGFPSICHMACHNSYRKDAYEKIIDGRCGRLRTRIIAVDNNSKIQRQELKKTEYSVINNGPKTIVEFAHAQTK